MKTVRRPPDANGLVLLPRRWAVDRDVAWIRRAGGTAATANVCLG